MTPRKVRTLDLDLDLDLDFEEDMGSPADREAASLANKRRGWYQRLMTSSA